MPKAKSIVYDDHSVVPVAGINSTLSETVAADTNSTAKEEKYIVSIKASDDLAFLIGDDGDTLAPATTVGIGLGITMDSGERTLPFILKAGKVIRATAQFQMVIHDVEG